MSNPATTGTTVERYRIGLVILRTFAGIVYLANGLAKLFEFKSIEIGPWKSYLINRAGAEGIQRANSNSSPGFLHDLGLTIANNFNLVQWPLTLGELAVGVGLILGLYSRSAAALGLLMSLGAFIFTLGSHAWTFDYLFEPAIFAVLLFAPDLPGPMGRLRRGISR